MMLTSVARRATSSGKGRSFATIIRAHNNKNSNAPLLEKYRPVWPDADFGKGKPEELPVRTVSDDVLRFELTASFESGTSLLYPHLPHNPADFKAKLKVQYHFYTSLNMKLTFLAVVLETGFHR